MTHGSSVIPRGSSCQGPGEQVSGCLGFCSGSLEPVSHQASHGKEAHPFGWGQSEATGPPSYLSACGMQPSVLFPINVESLNAMNNLDLDESLLTTEDDILKLSETLTSSVLGVFYPFPNLCSLTSRASHHSRNTEKEKQAST